MELEAKPTWLRQDASNEPEAVALEDGESTNPSFDCCCWRLDEDWSHDKLSGVGGGKYRLPGVDGGCWA